MSGRNKKNGLVFAALVVLAGLGACKKEIGVNQNLDPLLQTKFDYWSTKSGCWWKYATTDSASGDAFTRYSRDRDSVKNNLKYSYFERQGVGSGEFAPEYFGKNGDKYITLVDLDGNENNYLEYVFYIEGAGQGYSFNNIGKVPAPGLGSVSIKLSSDVSETGLTMNCNGHVFDSVIHIHTNGSAGLASVRIGTMDMWIRRGIGVLKSETHINVLGQYKLDHIDSLSDYHLEP